MSKIGIIANPAAGKDIRRLTAYASVTDSERQVGVLRRVIAAANASCVDEIVIMPDYRCLGLAALDGIRNSEMKCHVHLLDMHVTASAEDSTAAATLMSKQGVACIITIGGDGTNRVVARGCGSVPLIPISTGTNNVFPYMVDGTAAGLAASVVARGLADEDKCIVSTKKLNIIKDGRIVDLALVDVSVLTETFVGAKAILDMDKVTEVFSVQTHPSYTGMSSIGGSFYPVSAEDERGLYIRLGGNNLRVRAAIAPGLIEEIGIESFHVMKIGERIAVTDKPSILALDGEREIPVLPDESVEIELCNNGPRVVKIKETLEEAARNGFFVTSDTLAMLEKK
ncbi:MAG: NAD(+)/NADH kinase [Chloroflexi bacterium]|nr:NAD(+)/NADH kinase [Chloroflexota bacterium]